MIYICWVCYCDFTQIRKAVSNTLKLLPACSSTPASRHWPSKARDYLQSFVPYRSPTLASFFANNHFFSSQTPRKRLLCYVWEMGIILIGRRSRIYIPNNRLGLALVFGIAIEQLHYTPEAQSIDLIANDNQDQSHTCTLATKGFAPKLLYSKC